MKRTAMIFMLLMSLASADEPETQEWGLASALRSASVPYADTDGSRVLNRYVLLGYLETSSVFLDGTEGGLHLYRSGLWQADTLARQHFIDLPGAGGENAADDTLNFGFRLRYGRQDRFDAELLTDPAWRARAVLRLSHGMDAKTWTLRPYAEAAWNSAAYNSYYYGRDRHAVADDVSITAGAKGKVRLVGDIHLFGEVQTAYLGRAVADAPTIDDPVTWSLLVGAGVYQSCNASRSDFDPKGYLRVGVGEATPSSFTKILSAEGARDLHRLYMLSLFYGLPLSKTLFGANIHSYFSPGFVHHFGNELQRPAQEYVGAFKFYYQPDTWWLRFGFGTGLSYITDVTYIERHINEKDGYAHTSNLMQYLDFSCDVELDRLFGRGWEGLWFGYALHHRSGVFESARQYGQIKGGSNYNTLYVQLHFGE